MFVIHGHKRKIVSSEYFSGQCQICKSNRLFLCDLACTGSIFFLPIVHREFKRIICDKCLTEYKTKIVDGCIALRPLNKAAKLIRILETTKSVVYAFYTLLALFFSFVFIIIYCEKEIEKKDLKNYKQNPQIDDIYIFKSSANTGLPYDHNFNIKLDNSVAFPYKVMRAVKIKENEFCFAQLNYLFKDINSAKSETRRLPSFSSHLYSKELICYSKKEFGYLNISKIIRPSHKFILFSKEKFYNYFCILKDLFEIKVNE